MDRVLCVSYPVKGNVKVDFINKSIDELQNTNFEWISSSLKTMKTPNGISLEPCPWHSGACHAPGDINNPKLCCVDPAPEYGIWTTNYQVLDTCHLIQKAAERLRKEQNDKMSKLIEDYNKWFDSSIDLHFKFFQNILRRKELIEQKVSLENEIKKMNLGLDTKSNEYVALIEIQTREEKMVNERRESLLKEYNNSKQTIDFESFISKCMGEELKRYQKAKNNVTNWYNAHKLTDKSKRLERIEGLEKSINTLTNILKNSYEIPFVYLLRCNRNLTLISNHYSNRAESRYYSKEQLKEDQVTIKNYLAVYDEFLDKSISEIEERVSSMMKKSKDEEKKMRNTQAVKKVVEKKNIFLVRNDGSLKKEEVQEQIFINKIVTEEGSSGSWR